MNFFMEAHGSAEIFRARLNGVYSERLGGLQAGKAETGRAVEALVRSAALASAITGLEAPVIPLDRTAARALAPSGYRDMAALSAKTGLLSSPEDGMLRAYCGIVAGRSPRSASRLQAELVRITDLSARVYAAHARRRGGASEGALRKSMHDASYFGMCLGLEDKAHLRAAYGEVERDLARVEREDGAGSGDFGVIGKLAGGMLERFKRLAGPLE